MSDVDWHPDWCPPGDCPLERADAAVEPPTMQTERGRHIAEGLSEVLADVRLRLRREGQPIPAVPHDPAPGEPGDQIVAESLTRQDRDEDRG